MNIVFCHDGPISCINDSKYYAIGFNDKLFSRYEKIFGNVNFITRVKKIYDNSLFSESDVLSSDRFNVIEYPNFLNLKGVFANKSESNLRLEKAISQCDALIIRLPSFIGNKCVKIAKKYNKPYLIELVGCPWDSLRNHGLSGKLLSPYMYFITKHHVKKATDVLYVTDEFLQKRYPTAARSIGCSDVFIADTDKQIKLKPQKTKEQKIILGTASVLDVRYKGQEFVIQAIAELKKMGIDAEYWLAGSGTGDYLRQKAQKLGVEAQVKFCGLLDRDALNEFYDSVDIYIQPSLTEGMPRAVIEAMSSGCYCLGTEVGGIPELIGRENCFLKGNVKDILSKILQYYEDADNKNRIQCLNRSKNFSASLLENKRNEFYKSFRKFVEQKR